MSQRAQTKDERYLRGLYELAQAAGDVETEFDMFEVGQYVGQSPKAVKTIVALLARANFVRKLDKTRLRLTPNGERRLQDLMEA